jgi:hypothetical protein
MRSRSVRLAFGATAVVAIVAAAFFVVRSEQQLSSLRSAGRAYDLHAREVADAFSDLRSAQQAYVAVGQGVAFWMPKVAQTADAVAASVATLHDAATSTAARSAVDDAAATLRDFRDADARARDYLKAGQTLMAGDVIFTEGDQAAAAAARQVEASRLGEHEALDASEAEVRRQQAGALAGAGGVSALVLLLLGIAGGAPRAADEPVSLTPSAAGPSLRPAREPAPVPQVEGVVARSRAVSPILRTAARLCTDFGALHDVNGLQLLLARAADVMDAAGLVVWLADAAGSELQPVLSHGYSDSARARLPHVPRSANNAAAAAYRSGEVQIVVSQPGGSKGAIVAPIIGPAGCVGALSAEIRGGGEASESVQALAAIVAAQLAGVLAHARDDAVPTEARAAASS